MSYRVAMRYRVAVLDLDEAVFSHDPPSGVTILRNGQIVCR